MKAVIFAGPSIYALARDRRYLAEMRPPATCGDILRASNEDVQVIGLVDGCFELCPAVWHKEILAAMAGGISVFGAASMGALRAAECGAFGMIGLGRIFLDYLSGARHSDADVAVLHAPGEFEFEPLTEALVNVEATIEALAGRGIITVVEASVLLREARHIHFKDRTWERLCSLCGFAEDRARNVLQNSGRFHVDQKAADAELLIDAVERCCRAGVQPDGASLSDFNRTVYLRSLERRLQHRTEKREAALG